MTKSTGPELLDATT